VHQGPEIVEVVADQFGLQFLVAAGLVSPLHALGGQTAGDARLASYTEILADVIQPEAGYREEDVPPRSEALANLSILPRQRPASRSGPTFRRESSGDSAVSTLTGSMIAVFPALPMATQVCRKLATIAAAPRNRSPVADIDEPLRGATEPVSRRAVDQGTPSPGRSRCRVGVVNGTVNERPGNRASIESDDATRVESAQVRIPAMPVRTLVMNRSSVRFR
jgi:hypothetical protein